MCGFWASVCSQEHKSTKGISFSFQQRNEADHPSGLPEGALSESLPCLSHGRWRGHRVQGMEVHPSGLWLAWVTPASWLTGSWGLLPTGLSLLRREHQTGGSLVRGRESGGLGADPASWLKSFQCSHSPKRAWLTTPPGISSVPTFQGHLLT